MATALALGATVASPGTQAFGEAEAVVSQSSEPAPGAFGTETWRDPADELLPDVGSFLSRVSELVANRYGGGWIDRPTDPAARDQVAWLRVAIVGATDADRSAVAQLANDNRYVTVVPVTHGLAALEAWKELFLQYLVQMNLRDGSVDADEVANKVVVTLPSAPLGLAEYARLKGIPDDVWTLRLESNPVAPGHATRQDGPPYEAALEGDVWTGVVPHSGCTTWFTTITDGGSEKAITAGHCEDTLSDHLFLATTDFGDGATNTYLGRTRTRSDAVRYTIPNLQESPYILLSALNHSWVTNRFWVSHGGEPVVGTALCFVAYGTGGGNCGTVATANYSTLDTSGVWHDSTWKLNAPSNPGDSGGPLYKTNSDGSKKAAGMIWGVGSYTLFHHVSYVLADEQVDLYYYPW